MTETSIFKARVDEFHRRHGSECYSDGAKFYYADGAYRDLHHLGVLAEPHNPDTREGQYHNAEIVVLFYRCKLQAAAEKFDQFNVILSTTLPQRHERSGLLLELKRLRDAVEVCKRELSAAEQKLASTDIARRRAGIKEADEKRRQEWIEFHQKRQQLRI